MQHVEVHDAHLFTWSLLQVGVVALAALVILSVIVGLVVWRRGGRSRYAIG